MDHPARYPYGLDPLVPGWRDRKSRALVTLVGGALALALWLRWPWKLAGVDAIAPWWRRSSRGPRHE